jgi:hypothetical protein
MTLNFPTSPVSGDIHNASNGLQYSFDGIKWTSQGTYNAGAINAQKLDSIASSFNGSTTTFDLKVGGNTVKPASAEAIQISIANVIKEPTTAYTVNSSAGTITFTSAPAAGAAFFGIVFSRIPIDASTSVASVNGNTGAITAAQIASAVEAASDSNTFTDAEKTKLSGIALSANNYSISSDLLDEDNMASDSATKVPSQQSVKAYVDANGGGISDGDKGDITVSSSGATWTIDNNVIDTANIQDGAIVNAHISNGQITNLKMADDAIGIAELSATGTASGSTYLRGDNTWATVSGGGGISNVVEDTTPQLGGDLDVQAREITTSTTNGNIVLNPNGEFGVVRIKGDSTNTVDGTLELRCSSDSHGVKIKSPPHSAAQNYTLTLPSSIVNGAFLKTDSNGGLSFATPTDTNTQLSTEEVQDIAGPLVATGGTKTGISVTYDDTNGNMDFVVAAQTPEGTAILSTGETGGTKFLREDGDNTCSWQTVSASSLDSDAQRNTLAGYNAGNSFTGTDATDNTLIGYAAGSAVTTADKSVLIGSYSGDAITDTSYHTAVGYGTLTDNTSGIRNSAFGYNALANNTEGQKNCSFGFGSGTSINIGDKNVTIGYDCGNTLTTGDNCIVIGHNAQATAADVNGEVTIGDTGITKFRIPGLAGFQIDDNGTIDLPGAIDENVYTITDGASVDLDPDNGMIQTWTLGANRTATESLLAGQSMMLMVADGTSYTLTFPTMTWIGGSAPTLATSGYTVIELFKVGSTLYGAKVGDVA